MSFWSKFEEFFIKWFCGPSKNPNILREYAYTIGARESEKPSFSRNNLVDWSLAFSNIKAMYRTENHYLSTLFFVAESKPIGYHYLYYDFDDENDPERARREAMEFVNSVRDRYGAEPIVYFSGRKGYGVMILLDRPITFDVYRRLWNTLKAPFTFATLDPRVLDAKRVHRVPYTYNVKPDHVGFCYLVNPKTFRRMKMEDFDWNNYQPLKVEDVEHLIASIKRFDVPKARKYVLGAKRELKPLPPDPADLDQCDAVPPCIRNIVQQLKTTGNPDHFQRLALVWYLKWVGYSKEQVLELFRRFATDFNERIASYQIEYAYGERGKREDWLAPSCRWMKEHGLCLECGWNRNIVTYTYVRAYVPEEIKQRFFELVKRKSTAVAQ